MKLFAPLVLAFSMGLGTGLAQTQSDTFVPPISRTNIRGSLFLGGFLAIVRVSYRGALAGLFQKRIEKTLSLKRSMSAVQLGNWLTADCLFRQTKSLHPGMSTLAQTNAPWSANVEVCLQPNRR
jgi:hypothetical protein